MDTATSISVIIPSYNGAHKLPLCLNAIANQTVTGFEVVVVLDGSTDHSLDVLEPFRSSSAFRLKVVETPNGGRSVARNNGARAASNPILIFLDDDMECEAHLVEKHLAFQSKNGRHILVGGNFRNPLDAQTAFHQYLLAVENEWRRIKYFDGPIDFERYFFSSQNFSIPAALFHEIGRFDERLTDGEDFDFGLRALAAGVSITFDSGTNAFHHDWTDLQAYIRRHNQYARANHTLAVFHPDYLERFPELIRQPPSQGKQLLLKIARNTIVPAVINNVFLLRLLPQSMRFKLYRLAIAAHTESNFKPQAR